MSDKPPRFRWRVKRHCLAALALAFATPAHADRLDQWRPIIAEASLRFGIPSAWIERVMLAESAGRTTIDGRPTRSRAGAIGLMQLMPPTWLEMRARLKLGVDPDDPRDNIFAGAGYLRLMYDRFGYPGLFAGYNAGPGRYGAYLSGRTGLPRETLAYVTGVSDGHSRVGSTSRMSPAPALFVTRREGAQMSSGALSPAVPSSLFVIRRAIP